ncbi:MAG: hypothetical protein KAJ42_01190, partial [Gemmatimonadetes bacterium]|nr:hypothetical protein [Gemmatimonadota bacterium]
MQDHEGALTLLDFAPPGTPPTVDCSMFEPAPVSEPGGIAAFIGGAKRFAGSVLGMAAPQPLVASMYLHGGLTCMVPMFSTFYTILPTEGLVAHWPAEGNMDDIVGSLDGDSIGAVGFAPGIEGQAFDFGGDGSVVYVHPADSVDDLQQLTISAWVRMNPGRETKTQRFVTLGGEKAVLRQLSNPNGGYLQFFMTINGDRQYNYVNAPSTLRSGCFHHVVGTYDRSVIRLFLDGEEVGHRSTPGAATVDPGEGIDFSSHSPHAPEGVEDPNAESLDGRLDEVMIYDRALSIAEVAAMYEAADPAGKCQVASGNTSTFWLDDETISVGDSTLITLQARDPWGDDILSGGAIVNFFPRHGATTGRISIRPEVDNGDGTYSAWAVGNASGLPVHILADVQQKRVTTGDAYLTVEPIGLSAQDAEDLIGDSFWYWWWGNHGWGPGPILSVAADEHTSSWRNWGMEQASTEPRVAWNNDSESLWARGNRNPWVTLYGGLVRA